jgi:hypothetical protein
LIDPRIKFSKQYQLEDAIDLAEEILDLRFSMAILYHIMKEKRENWTLVTDNAAKVRFVFENSSGERAYSWVYNSGDAHVIYFNELFRDRLAMAEQEGTGDSERKVMTVLLAVLITHEFAHLIGLWIKENCEERFGETGKYFERTLYGREIYLLGGNNRMQTGEVWDTTIPIRSK